MATFLRPQPWILPTRTIAVRLFLTCWLIYSIHAATNTVREIYLALAIGDHFSFRVDEYANMHPDLFEKKGYGWHIGANPGGSMVGAVPYFLARPVIDRVVAAVNRSRAASGAVEPPTYNSPWPMVRAFYREAWRRGLDVKFALAAIVMQSFAMAPISALSAVAMFFLLRRVFASDRAGFWLALLYAVATPVFFRTGYLNHNMMLGEFAFMGFLVLWNPGQDARWPPWIRWFLGGLAGGAALLFDYSGIVLLGGLFLYAVVKGRSLQTIWWYGVGAAGPIFLLWFYQWASFGNPFLPGQNWMPPVEWIDQGYQGFTLPQADILAHLLADYRYGLFTTCPLLLLALAAPFLNRRAGRCIPTRELAVTLLIPASLWLFCGGISYTRLQFNTGLRYLAPVLPFLFVPAALTLARLPRQFAGFLAVFAVAQAWSMAMYRDVERGLGLLDPVLHVFSGGFQLPILSNLSRMSGQYGDYTAGGASPLPIFVLAAALLWVLWRGGRSAAPVSNLGKETASLGFSELATRETTVI